MTGDLWQDRGKAGYLENVTLRVEAKRERVTMDFPGQDKRSVFEPNRVEMQRRDGTIVASRDNPEASFAGQGPLTPWDDIHVAYFSGEAFYTYCNIPFLCTYDGFASEEIGPIQVDGETWRRLKVIFPDRVSVIRGHRSSASVRMVCFGVRTTPWTSLGGTRDSTMPLIIATSMASSFRPGGECTHTRPTANERTSLSWFRSK